MLELAETFNFHRTAVEKWLTVPFISLLQINGAANRDLCFFAFPVQNRVILGTDCD